MGRFRAGNPGAGGRGGGAARSAADEGSKRRRDRRRDTARSEVIDLSDDGPDADEPVDPEERARRAAEAAELSARFRARRARAEAEAELARLRRRHWSGERVIEEGRIELEWWEHPEADPYAVLGLLPGATLEQASAARRRVAHDCHPDRVDLGTEEGQEALRRMVAANAAHERLRRSLRPD